MRSTQCCSSTWPLVRRFQEVQILMQTHIHQQGLTRHVQDADSTEDESRRPLQQPLRTVVSKPVSHPIPPFPFFVHSSSDRPHGERCLHTLPAIRSLVTNFPSSSAACGSRICSRGHDTFPSFPTACRVTFLQVADQNSTRDEDIFWDRVSASDKANACMFVLCRWEKRLSLLRMRSYRPSRHHTIP
ncbi:hypothetical protein NPIL_484401 [Nephila pilipes]|uniref:Uncharacterized protein n=1 Tax=Nephila pilipes TaxID=299642 RepID=A0A8X6Q2C2_NEPPI|nr:hypothetical protein NPIL_484401 [Nephila pilipes]